MHYLMYQSPAQWRMEWRTDWKERLHGSLINFYSARSIPFGLSGVEFSKLDQWDLILSYLKFSLEHYAICTKMSTNTLKEVCLGRKPTPENPIDYCRCCKVSLKVHFIGKSFYAVAKEKSWRNGTVASALKATTLFKIFYVWSSLQTLCCEIRKTSEGFSFIAKVLNEINPKFVAPIASNLEDELTDAVLPRTERTLATSVSTPKRSPGKKKVTKTSDSPTKDTGKCTAWKSLGFRFESDVRKNEDAVLNTDVMISSEQPTRGEVVVLWLSGKSDVREAWSKGGHFSSEKIWPWKLGCFCKRRTALRIKARYLVKSSMAYTEFRPQYCSSDLVLKHRTTKELQ